MAFENIRDILQERNGKGLFREKRLRRALGLIALVLVAFGPVGSCFGQSPAFATYSDGPLSRFDAQVDQLLGQMSLEEKAGQMTQVTLEMLLKKDANGKVIEPAEFVPAMLDSALSFYRVGSILNNVGHTMDLPTWHRLLKEIHGYRQPAGRPKLPVLYGVDAIHGANYTMGATLFPQEISLAATWEPRFATECGTVTAYETRASGIPWNFSPVLDLGRQPLWSRIFETFGEDVLLAQTMAKAIVKGYQGDSLGNNSEKVAACLKHFVGYSMSRTGKDRTPAWIPDRQLREYFLPVFQSGIDAGAQTIMINSGEVNGVPVHASHDLLTKTLRGEMGFKGFTVSDWEDVIMLHTTHKVAASEREAVKIAIMAGMDMSMVPLRFDFAKHVVDLVRTGELPESLVDQAVRRILTVKFKLGLFENPLPNLAGFQKFGSPEFSEMALNAARESITLLKNEVQTLPLAKGTKILVSGPGANSLNALNGAWTHTWQGVDTTFNTKGKATILESLRNMGGAKNVTWVPMSFADTVAPKIKAAASKADVIVLCIGELPSTEKPGDIDALDLPLPQQMLVREAAKLGKPIVLVLLEGRPRLIADVEPLADAIVMGYLPGDEGGKAIAEVLYGTVNPSGKLPYTYPRSSGDLTHYDHKFSETKDNKFGNNAIHPQYTFGHGLSYTQFSYGDLVIENDSIGKSETLVVSVKVTNTGGMAGKEVVQLYVRDEYASIVPSVRRLRGFQKIGLAPGESKEVQFKLGPEDLRFVDLQNSWRVEPGTYTLMIGSSSKQFYAAWESHSAVK